jgi:hypothetical protein
MKFRFVGNHVEDLDDGSILEPLQYVELDEEATHSPRAETLLAEGKLIPAGETKKQEDDAAKEAANAKRRVTRRDNAATSDDDEGEEGKEA